MSHAVRLEGSLSETRSGTSLTLVCSPGCRADDASAATLFDHLYTSILVAEEDSTRVDGEDTFPMIQRD